MQPVPGSNLAPLPRPSTSGGFMISGDQLQKTQQPLNKTQRGNTLKSTQSPPNKYRTINGNVLPASEVNPVTIRKVPQTAHHLT